MKLHTSFSGNYKTNAVDSHYLLTPWEQFVCVEVLRPSQLNGVMPSVVSLPNHTFTGQA